MKKILSTFLLVSATLFLYTACKKNDETAAPATPPTVSMTSPVENDQMLGGQLLKIKGQISDAAGLHTLSVKITDDKTGAILFQSTPTVLNMKTYTLDASWTVKVNDWTDATMTVTATNHAAMQTVKTVKFKMWL